MSNISALNLMDTFNDVLWYFQHIILPICFLFGNIGNCLNLIIFSQHSSRSNSCLLYFLSSSIINIFILNFGLILRILRGIWNIDPAIHFLWFCRCRTYLINVCFLIYRYSILLACIDRMCASSRSAWIRRMSRPQIAYRLIIISWIFSITYFIPTLIFPVIVYGQCLAPFHTTYATFLTISTLIQGLIIPLIMIICGMITVGHLKSIRSRIVPRNERRLTTQYIVMLLIQIVTDCLSNIVYEVYLIYSLVYNASQTAEIATISFFLINLSFNMPYINYSTAFYLHTLSSPAFRRKLFRIIKRFI